MPWWYECSLESDNSKQPGSNPQCWIEAVFRNTGLKPMLRRAELAQALSDEMLFCS